MPMQKLLEGYIDTVDILHEGPIPTKKTVLAVLKDKDVSRFAFVEPVPNVRVLIEIVGAYDVELHSPLVYSPSQDAKGHHLSYGLLPKNLQQELLKEIFEHTSGF